MSSTRPARPAPRVHRDPGASLTRYRVMALATGVMLLLLCVELLYKYVYLGHGFLDQRTTPLDFIAYVHGWVYFVYLIAVADLWSKLRWPMGRLLVLVLCGVVPLLSFWAERRVVADVRAGRSGPSVPASPGAPS
ncbi:DUF3817 domain-containing protein [Quadrisphaera sp. INWT6]|uniref:DUF3817 domain-containing protein n=1 Tax=Quadrisphaera sp. INWT6 TaxID=2596917 RepID=UPI001892753D|nr:DUF3817 domain-containing protein [Quadrisphaera sp. INWT6]MBF5081640.1 DUF3817 domain-containing protein [Quadrisphaera sp. INWT6]